MNETTRERILIAAAETFAETGFAGARIDEIAEKAGVNKAMLYYHVGSKEDLYTAVLTETFDRGLSSIRASVESAGTPAAKLQAILNTFAHFGSENPVFIPIVMREIASGGKHLPDEMVLRMASVFRLVGDTLRSGMEAGAFRRTDPLLTHVSLTGAMMFLIASHPVRQRVARIAGVDAGAHTPAELAAHVGNLFLHGLTITPAKAKKVKS
ncbi:MAG: TetR/AcrR family transcriptional regulator [Thermoanaerobaculia bacterium]|nr:TetR/AcrR family transcriptional regulator [Thermoanaerobaculia bacterium]